MTDVTNALRVQLTRQVGHWRGGAVALEEPESLASATAWSALERYLGIALRRQLGEAVARLTRAARQLERELAAAHSLEELERVRARLVGFRRQFLRIETLLDYYGDAVNTRTSPRLAALLSACDALAVASMQRALRPLGMQSPPVLTYVDKGLGASILRAGLRLWDDGSPSTVASIKIARHNLGRPTALIHEAGHQFAHMTGWNDELASVLRLELARDEPQVAAAWGSWASEIAADAFAFVTTGYGCVAALHDVLAGEEAIVFRHLAGDPHPIAYLRVLLGTRMCRRFYGPGPWDELADAWLRVYPLDRAPPQMRELLGRSVVLLPRAVELILARPMRAFGGRSLAELVDPAAVSPAALDALERDAGAALFRSSHWLHAESLRLLAVCSLRAATAPERSVETAALQEQWMVRLGAPATRGLEAA